MNNPRYAKMAICTIFLTIFFWYGWAQAQPINSKSEQGTVDVGRDNPFANFLNDGKSTSQKDSETSQMVEGKPGLFVETVTLKFLDAKNLKPAIAGMSSDYGSISIDDKSNSLIVCDTKENLEKILAQIRKADRTPEQIMIEVVILDVQLGDAAEIGVDWDRFFETVRDQNYIQTLIPLTLTKNNIIGIVQALQQIRNVEILASPRILVTSGQEALIQSTEEIPYIELSQTSGGGADAYAIASTEFKEAGITLKVKATVTDEQKILMTIEPEQSINTGEAGVGNTTLLMENGQVLAMGGLRKKEIRMTKNQIPLLGDIPIVGFLFSYDKRDVKNTELIVLISPHIDGEPVSEDAMEKFKEITERPLLSLPPDWREPFRNIGKQPPKK
jgi:type II secretory pathway component GspD/PulD (secretin)